MQVWPAILVPSRALLLSALVALVLVHLLLAPAPHQSSTPSASACSVYRLCVDGGCLSLTARRGALQRGFVHAAGRDQYLEGIGMTTSWYKAALIYADAARVPFVGRLRTSAAHDGTDWTSFLGLDTGATSCTAGTATAVTLHGGPLHHVMGNSSSVAFALVSYHALLDERLRSLCGTLEGGCGGACTSAPRSSSDLASNPYLQHLQAGGGLVMFQYLAANISKCQYWPVCGRKVLMRCQYFVAKDQDVGARIVSVFAVIAGG